MEAGEASPLDIVLAADRVTQRLEAEKKQLEEQQLESFDALVQKRLEDIYADLAARDADGSESLARRILLGLGFPHAWQVLSATALVRSSSLSAALLLCCQAPRCRVWFPGLAHFPALTAALDSSTWSRRERPRPFPAAGACASLLREPCSWSPRCCS